MTRNQYIVTLLERSLGDDGKRRLAPSILPPEKLSAWLSGEKIDLKYFPAIAWLLRVEPWVLALGDPFEVCENTSKCGLCGDKCMKSLDLD